MKYMLIVPVMAAVFFLYGFIFPPAPVTTTSCYLDVNSPSVRVMAEEINVEMVPVVGFNNRIFYYQGITHNLESGPYVITDDNSAGYIRPFAEKDSATVDVNTLPSCLTAVPARQ